jgi:hypothetical protein
MSTRSGFVVRSMRVHSAPTFQCLLGKFVGEKGLSGVVGGGQWKKERWDSWPVKVAMQR